MIITYYDKKIKGYKKVSLYQIFFGRNLNKYTAP